jgi:hypothetical protein
MAGKGRCEQFLREQVTEQEWELLRRNELTERPLGDE